MLLKSDKPFYTSVSRDDILHFIYFVRNSIWNIIFTMNQRQQNNNFWLITCNTFMDKYIEPACNVLTPPTFRWLMIGLQARPTTRTFARLTRYQKKRTKMENLPKINILEELLLLQQKHHIHLCGYKITHLKSHYRCILPGARGIKFIYEHQKRIHTATKHFEWEYLRYIVKIFIFGLLLGGTNHKPIKLAQRIKYIRLLNRLNHSLKKLEKKYIHMI